MKPTPRKNKEDEAKEIAEDLSSLHALDALRDTEGGRVLVKSLVSDIIGAVDSIATNAHKLTHMEFIALGIRIKERVDIARALNRAKSQTMFLRKELRTVLEEIEADAPPKEETPAPASSDDKKEIDLAPLH